VKPFASWIAISVAVVVVALVGAVAIGNWGSLGNSGISVNGWIALALGVLATLAVGVGLMALVFISNRRGYDEPPRQDR
jgi:uncharacterized protein YneF (UPF0154 family)